LAQLKPDLVLLLSQLGAALLGGYGKDAKRCESSPRFSKGRGDRKKGLELCAIWASTGGQVLFIVRGVGDRCGR